MKHIEQQTKNALVLPGGGARAAYQVGVLKALAELLPADAPIPFSVIAGTSAGSINAAALAAHARRFSPGVDSLNGIWSNLRVDNVFRTDLSAILGNLAYWLWSLMRGKPGANTVPALLDTRPLRSLLERHIRFSHIQQAIDEGVLDALAITASGYTSAQSTTFFQGRSEFANWQRTRREGCRAEIVLDHVMASTALPLIFPAIRIGQQYFGDGAIRQTVPLSPAVHLGADRILIISLRDSDPNEVPEHISPDAPGFGQIMGYLLDTLFMDSLYADLERVQRINDLIEQAGSQKFAGEHLRPIKTTLVVPGTDIRDIVQRHAKRMPLTVRMLLRNFGGLKHGNRQLLSYLLFDGHFCSELIELGYADAVAQKDTLQAFITKA